MSTVVPAFEVDEAGLAQDLRTRFDGVRRATEALCATLETEDYVLQSMPDASPVKWHLAHTTWFFETFLLVPEAKHSRAESPEYSYLFNSYYNAVGDRIPRAQRGLLTRPTVAEVYRYRAAVDSRMRDWIERLDATDLRRLAPTIVLGLNHEQQHQELILTDLKHAFGSNPLRPVFRERAQITERVSSPLSWLEFGGGLCHVGRDGTGFAFDNEGPRHRHFLDPYLLSNRLVTNGEYLGFIDAGGYDRPEFWLSDGWYARQTHGWKAPLYWEKRDTSWQSFTLAGMKSVDEHEPVCHLSFYEADAYARWAGARLPTEQEWESAVASLPIEGNLAETECFHPSALGCHEDSRALAQCFGDVWEWTRSPYSPYPGYQPVAGALGEYNGKFMCNQMVLRGGSCATPRSHIRASYRNFFPPEARWQFSGLRLARDMPR